MKTIKKSVLFLFAILFCFCSLFPAYAMAEQEDYLSDNTQAFRFNENDLFLIAAVEKPYIEPNITESIHAAVLYSFNGEYCVFLPGTLTHLSEQQFQLSIGMEKGILWNTATVDDENGTIRYSLENNDSKIVVEENRGILLLTQETESIDWDSILFQIDQTSQDSASDLELVYVGEICLSATEEQIIRKNFGSSEKWNDEISFLLFSIESNMKTRASGAANEYVLNTNTKKFHYPSCSSVKEMSDKNKLIFYGTREEIIEKGYTACKRCKP